MRKKLGLLLMLILPINVLAQNCLNQHLTKVKEAYTSVVGEKRLNSLKGEKILYLEYTCDTTGKILKINRYKIFNRNISKKEYKKICAIFEKNVLDICNTEPEFSFEDYLKINKNKPKYKLLFKG